MIRTAGAAMTPAAPQTPSAQGKRTTPSSVSKKPINSPTSPLSKVEPTHRVAAAVNSRVSLKPMITEKKTGVRKIPKTVTPSMPLNTAIPSDRRISEPAPAATARGITPTMNANEVIRIGRSRCRHASRVASCRDKPSRCICLAYSTIRMAFLHASPTSTTRPICTKILTSRPV